MSIVVTAATGHLGRLVLEALLAKGVTPSDIVAGGRSVEKLQDFADQGVRVQVIDYDRPETLTAAFQGADRVLFISGSDAGKRITQHQNVVDAARAANVGLIAYTSIPKVETTTMQLAADHIATEAALKASGLPVVLLRHGWYLENYTAQLPAYLEHGAVAGAAGGGRISAASRADFAAADVAALLESKGGEVYELGGDEAFTLTELAAEVSRQSGKEVVYNDLPTEAFAELLAAVGVPVPFNQVLADVDRAIRDGELYIATGSLSELAGRPTTSLADAIKAAL